MSPTDHNHQQVLDSQRDPWNTHTEKRKISGMYLYLSSPTSGWSLSQLTLGESGVHTGQVATSPPEKQTTIQTHIHTFTPTRIVCLWTVRCREPKQMFGEHTTQKDPYLCKESSIQPSCSVATVFTTALTTQTGLFAMLRTRCFVRACKS